MSRRSLQLFLASLLSLFLELVCIRWVSANVRLVGYSVNLMLIAAFLGLGLGFLLSKKDGRWMLMPALLLLAVAVAIFRRVQTVVPSDGVDVWSSYGLDHVTMFAKDVPWQLVILLFFVLAVVTFVPIGQIVGRLMEGQPPLRAYAINIAGSLAGVACFATVAALCSGPVVWLGLSLVLILLMLLDRPKLLALSAGLGVAVLAVTLFEDQGARWSPYQKITTRARPNGFDLYVNDDRHQFALDLRKPADAKARDWRRVYDFPYRAAPKLDRVLIVGSGSGNDVAGALRNGAKRVDAVEIDPVILQVGRERHPEGPYSDSRVTPHNEDARAFFKQTTDAYDLIVFGYLDSHMLFSSMANVRLDEYVYTVESFGEAHARLAPGGAMCVVFCATKPWVRAKLVRMLNEVSGAPPRVAVLQPDGVDTTILWVGPAPKVDDIPLTTATLAEAEVPRDDWPFLYLEGRRLPVEYLPMIFGVLILGAGSTAWAAARRFSWVFFFLGAGFMLVETLSITRFALLAGSTWIITSLTISAILVMALLSTWIVQRFRQPGPSTALVLAIGAIGVSFAIPSEQFIGLSLAARLAVGAGIIGLPVVFSGIAFSRLFSRVENPATALGANLMGAVLGGMGEYLSMVTGFRQLYLLAAALYACAWIAVWLEVRRGGTRIA